jgi:transcription termination factor Rho
MLLEPDEYRRICVLRRVLGEMNPTDAMELLINRLAKTKSNAEFLSSLKS